MQTNNIHGVTAPTFDPNAIIGAQRVGITEQLHALVDQLISANRGFESILEKITGVAKMTDKDISRGTSLESAVATLREEVTIALQRGEQIHKLL